MLHNRPASRFQQCLRTAAALALTGMLAVGRPLAQGNDPAPWIEAELDRLIPLYEHLHSHPELSFEEVETAARIAEELRAAGFDVAAGVGGHGVVGVLANGDGPTIMFRSDLDALPVTEETGLPYASTVRTHTPERLEIGVMHACGHDLHMTNLVGLARWLAAHRDAWRGTALLIGQPAEERGNGARRMLDDGLFERFPRPQFALALHCSAEMESGKIGFRAGYALANTDSCDVVIRGRGGHGSAPQHCIDPIVQAAQLVLELQTIVSREISPLEPAVITVGSIHGGTKHNIIPDECRLQLTIRSYAPEVREHLHRAIERKARGVAEAAGAPEPTVEFQEGTPAVYNDDDLVARVVPTFVEVLGEDQVETVDRAMGGEDFSFFGLAGTPIFLFRLGTVAPETLAAARRDGTPLPTLHSSKYAPDVRRSLSTGLLASITAMKSLMPPRK